MKNSLLLSSAAAILLFHGIASANDETDRQQNLNGGYYLLYKLAEDEAQVPLLLDLKHAPPAVGTFADRISKVGKMTEAAIEKFHDEHAGLRYDRSPLPDIEQNVRDSIKDDKQHQLLFGTKDAEFVRAFGVSQIEASTYGLNLCKVLADQETSKTRANKLHALEAKWLACQQEAYHILRNY